MPQLIASVLRKLSPVQRNLVLCAELSRIPDASSCAVLDTLGATELDEASDLSRETADERSLMQSRFRCGHMVVGGRVDGALAFYACVMFGEMEIGPRTFPISPAFVCSYKVFTAPAFRGRGIASAYYAFLRRELSAPKCVLATVAPHNEASIGMHRRCGFTSFGTTWELRGTDRARATKRIWELVDAESCEHDVSWPGLIA